VADYDRRDLGSEPSAPAGNESLKLLAALQVKIDILRRAQTLVPQLVEELQTTFNEIQQELRDLDC